MFDDRTNGVAEAAVDLRRPAAAAVTLIVHSHLQAVLKPHRLYGEGLVGAAGRAATSFHTHIKGHLPTGQSLERRKPFLLLSKAKKVGGEPCVTLACWCGSGTHNQHSSDYTEEGNPENVF